MDDFNGEKYTDVAEINSDQNTGDENSENEDFYGSGSFLFPLGPLPTAHGRSDSTCSYRLSKTFSSKSINMRQSMLNWKQEEMERKLMDLGKKYFP